MSTPRDTSPHLSPPQHDLEMRSSTILASAAAAGLATASSNCKLPHVDVPACPAVGTVLFNSSVPDRSPFPATQVDLCYTSTALHLAFTARDERSFYFDPAQTTNGDIWQYEVMEAFLHRGDADPQTYLEFEVSPNNVTYQAFVYNPSKERAAGAPFDHAFISDPAADGFAAKTTLDKQAGTWRSEVSIPLGLFNVDEGKARGTRWRMNFFRTVVSPETFPDQQLGAWSVPDKASFHISKYFGTVNFV
ncbi:Carbohydrate-binding domain, family 9-like, subgroup [Cordyceps fumosorosea ARSEF 2679]|uniref:Carbohydrate-binding domain, family 9-like, subgroup n=1 Tax=Cordyceps fumosorosea (strain ARSEF 2679) TaxID=1081104 RepID=A0A167PM49_CORFA|nr:Carbohydrate-binding domain, family 9-like, subgroup [Cordyceps fumosorosea ARSEF 2679]OAA56808.1 Carbohydrate-binding domain, family 9-like, subgroup [Cordyceps fumosorosea ARSEF 2679]